jgi:hypothetical protein
MSDAYADRRAARVQVAKSNEKFGLKTDKQLTTSKYTYYLTPELEAIVDKTTLAALLSTVEVCYKKFGPAPNSYAEFPRDGQPGVVDKYINVSGLATMFKANAGNPVPSRLEEFMGHKQVKHMVNHVVNADDVEFERVVENIKALTSKQFLFIINNALKVTAGVAVPVFYFKEENDQGNVTVFVSPTRSLDHPDWLPEAQFRLANGLTKNRPWAVRPEHLEAYAVLEAEYLAKKAAKEKEDKEKYEKFGEPHHNEPGFAEAFMAKLALEKAAKGV